MKIYFNIFSAIAITLIFISCDKGSLTDSNGPIVSGIPEKFYNYSIYKFTELKTYDFKNINLAAETYKASGMRWFAGTGISQDLDSNLVPIIHYDFGDYRNPVSTCHVAFAFYKYLLETPSEYNRKGFLNNVDWLINNCDKDYYLRYGFDFGHDNGILMEKGWISAMAQGEALAAVSMAYNLTGEKKYLNAAHGFFKTLHTNKGETWCVGIDDEGYYWLEEYPNKDFCHVLNGYLFGLWGIWDYYLITGDEFALKLFSAGIKTIVDNYKIWKVYGVDGSRYCTHRMHKDPNYHPIHLEELRSYSKILDIPEFKTAADYLQSTTVVPE